jgi:hypothetical protein
MIAFRRTSIIPNSYELREDGTAIAGLTVNHRNPNERGEAWYKGKVWKFVAVGPGFSPDLEIREGARYLGTVLTRQRWHLAGERELRLNSSSSRTFLWRLDFFLTGWTWYVAGTNKVIIRYSRLKNEVLLNDQALLHEEFVLLCLLGRLVEVLSYGRPI